MEKEIKAVVCPVGKAPEVRQIKNGLKAAQAVVGGYLQAVPLIAFYRNEALDGLWVILNEEGKNDELPPNRKVPGDIFVGQFFVVGQDDEGEFESLTDAQVAVVCDVFKSYIAK